VYGESDGGGLKLFGGCEGGGGKVVKKEADMGVFGYSWVLTICWEESGEYF